MKVLIKNIHIKELNSKRLVDGSAGTRMTLEFDTDSDTMAQLFKLQHCDKNISHELKGVLGDDFEDSK